MDNSNYSKNSHNEHLGVNKFGKNIKKTHPVLQQPNFARPQSQPQVYRINKNDFRNIVQQLTGSPSHHSQEPLLPKPPQNPPPKSPSMRLQRIRPPPMNINSPQTMVQNGLMGPVPVNDHPARPGRPMVQPPGWANSAESPVSAYMRYLQHSVNNPAQQPQQSSGLLPNPTGQPPRTNGNGPPLLPSPTSQFLLPSPSGYLNLSSPRSPYPLLSPGYQHPPPLTPNYPFSPAGQPGILGPRPGPQPPLSPGIRFPSSPGFFGLSSPRWRN